MQRLYMERIRTRATSFLQNEICSKPTISVKPFEQRLQKTLPALFALFTLFI